MSLLTGLIRFDKKVQAKELQHMSNHLAQWQPDKQHFWLTDNVGLYHGLRYNTPESINARYPVASPDQNVWIAWHARLDNREVLQAAFQLDNTQVANMSDGELLLLAYQHWQHDCVKHLLGDFVFVIWNRQTKSLFAARDHLGMKNLYYHYNPNKGLFFANCIRPLIEHHDIPVRPNQKALAQHLLLMPDAVATGYEGIQRLDAGHTLHYHDKQLRSQRYWELTQQSKSMVYPRDQDYVDHAKELFSRAVLARTRTAYPLGSELSGGLDSSTVSVVAADHLKKHNQTLYGFSAVPPKDFTGPARRGKRVDDSAWAQAVATQAGNIDLEFITTAINGNIFSNIKTLQLYSDLPVTNMINAQWFAGIYRAAHRKNIRTVLNGSTGNFCLSWPGEKTTGLSWLRRRIGFIAHQYLPFHIDLLKQRPPWRNFSAVSLNYANLHSLVAAYQQFYLDKSRTMQARTSLERYLPVYRGVWTAWYHILGVEGVDPTNDIDFVQFCLTLPNRLFMNKNQKRCLVRKMMLNRLPKAVLNQVTIGAQAPNWHEVLLDNFSSIKAVAKTLCQERNNLEYIDRDLINNLLSQLPQKLDRMRSCARSHDVLEIRRLLLTSLSHGQFVNAIKYKEERDNERKNRVAVTENNQ